MSDPSPNESNSHTCTESTLVVCEGPSETPPRPRPENSPRYFPGRTEPPGYSSNAPASDDHSSRKAG
jgi:hypothetical protein